MSILKKVSEIPTILCFWDMPEYTRVLGAMKPGEGWRYTKDNGLDEDQVGLVLECMMR